MSTKTYPQLDAAADLVGTDLLASWRGVGPLKRLVASAVKDYVLDGLASSSVAFTPGATGGLATTVQSKLREVVAFSDNVASPGANDTAALQEVLDYAAGRAAVDGRGIQYNVASLRIPSNTVLLNPNLKAVASTSDVNPIFIDGREDAKSNIFILNPRVDGNRVNQTLLETSGGDGQRAGISIWGRASDVTILRPWTWYCATDGIFIWSAGVNPEDGDDQLFQNVQILGINAQWNGRHGCSSCSERGVTLTFAQANNNGRDMPGYPASPYSSGGNGRRVNPADADGHLYGDGYRHESADVGENYSGLELAFAECVDNSGAITITETVEPDTAGFTQSKGISLSVARCNSPQHALPIYPVTFNQASGYGGSLKTFQGVTIVGNFEDAALSLSGIDTLKATGTVRIGSGGSGSNSAILTNCSNYGLDIASDKPTPFIDALPVAVVSTTQTTGSGWTIGTPSLGLVKVLPDGSFRLLYTVTVTPDAAEKGLFAVQLTSGWSVSDISGRIFDVGNGAFVSGYPIPSGLGANYFAFGYTATNTAQATVTVNLTATRT